MNYHFGAAPWAAQWADAPPYAKAPAGAPPIAYTAGWSFKGGSRLWLSRGRFQWDASAVPHGIATGDPNILVSRLTYHGLDGLSGELFGRLDSPWGVFLKSNVGIAGYDFLRGANYKLGGFIGWAYYAQNSDTMGCMQIANPMTLCPASADQIIGSQDTQWNAPRVGLSAETMLTERWRLSTDVAYLPWTDFAGRDHHLLRPRTTFIDHRGNGGGGVQVEGVLSYFITDNLSLGVGGRYWAMWTQKDSEAICTGCYPGTTAAQFSKFSIERWGTFFQASYKVN